MAATITSIPIKRPNEQEEPVKLIEPVEDPFRREQPAPSQVPDTVPAEWEIEVPA